ncbi:tyrosine-type recombinase/integrase [Oscillibacter sp.]|uniref:tyrosine-type recombinase/integrase n=1 Tax=Oscillibacter sp. TaxID=1945593 RepID=UPI0028A03724|nr:tyrosine-type recombinase/integrase [Oscillibacter sp.]
MARKEYLTKTITLPDGKRKYITAKSQEELKEKTLTARIHLRAGVDLSDQTTVGELAQLWFDVEKRPSVRESTANFWAGIIDRNILPYLSNRPVRDVLPIQIHSVMNAASEKSQSESRHTLQALRGMFNMGVDNNLIVKSPVPISMKAGGTPTKEKEALTEAQERTLLNAVSGTRAFLFVLLGLKTGMRRGEILGLKWDCVDIENNVVSVRRNLVYLKGRAILEDCAKTNAGIRDIPIPPEVSDALAVEKSITNSEFVIHSQDFEMASQSSFRSLWGIVAARSVRTDSADSIGTRRHPDVKRTIDFEVTPHLLRHTYATRLFERGLKMTEVQYLLGHESPDITMKIYVHYCEAQNRQSTFKKARRAMTSK